MRAPTAEQAPVEFFGLNASYNIDASSNTDALLTDASVLLGVGLAVLLKYEEDLPEELWGCAYLLRQSKAALDQGHKQYFQDFQARRADAAAG